MSVGFVSKVTAPLFIDSHRGWKLDSRSCERFSSEIVQLQSLATGLAALYRHIGSKERANSKMLGRIVASGLGAFEHLLGPPGLGDCMFQWYSVSLCSYVDLVFTMATDAGLAEAAERNAYREEVEGPIRAYRNKVAAHFARTWPIGDNEADQLLSIAPQLSVSRGRFWVGLVSIGMGSVKSEHGYAWGLTLEHERLSERYPFLASRNSSRDGEGQHQPD